MVSKLFACSSTSVNIYSNKDFAELSFRDRRHRTAVDMEGGKFRLHLRSRSAALHPRLAPPTRPMLQVWSSSHDNSEFSRVTKNSHNRHLKPGGWLEFQCIDGSLKCDDGTLPEDSQFKEYDRLLRAAASAFGTPLEDPTGYAKWFEGAGFEGVTEKVFKMPTSPWPKDPRLRLVGAFEQENLTVNLEGISQRVFEKGLGWSADESAVFFAAVRKDIRNRRHHSYYPFYAVYGQKPSTATSNRSP